MSVLLPEPETPVTQTSSPRGRRTSMFLRLLALGPLTTMLEPLPGRLTTGSGISLRPLRYWPVIERGSRLTLAGGPVATTWPPCSPAPGPRSIRWSAALMIASSCSTMMTVLPMSRSRCSVPIRRASSTECRPTEGSSQT